MSAELITGYYGKIPNQGDIVSRGLPRTFIEPWDRWLQETLLLLEAHLGPDWPRWFQSLAPTRFALNAGTCGPSAWIGVILPSQDRVGRLFPLTLCRRVASEQVGVGVFQREADWFSATEKLAQSMLEGLMDPTTLILEERQETKQLRLRRWLPAVRQRPSWWLCPVETQVVRTAGLPSTELMMGWLESGLAGPWPK